MHLVLLIVFLFGVLISLIACEFALRPNILVILADDFGYSDAGCYGGKIETPHVELRAKETKSSKSNFYCINQALDLTQLPAYEFDPFWQRPHATGALQCVTTKARVS
jgi:hypothetical protein